MNTDDRPARNDSRNDPLTLEAIDAQGCGLSIRFVWHVDRYAHTIALVEAGRIVPVLASVEGADDDLWPPSPPLQSLNLQEEATGGRAALLVGMAGRNHWSMSAVATGGERSSDPPTIVLDVACRLHQQGEALASAYRSMVAAAVEPAGQVARLDIAGCRCELEMLSAGDATGSLQTSEAGLSIMAPPDESPSESSSPTTIRWKYRVRRVDRRS